MIGTVGDDTLFSQAVQRLQNYAEFGDSIYWPGARPSPADVERLLWRYRTRRDEIRWLKSGRNLDTIEINRLRAEHVLVTTEVIWRRHYCCRRRLQPLVRRLLK